LYKFKKLILICIFAILLYGLWKLMVLLMIILINTVLTLIELLIYFGYFTLDDVHHAYVCYELRKSIDFSSIESLRESLASIRRIHIERWLNFSLETHDLCKFTIFKQTFYFDLHPYTIQGCIRQTRGPHGGAFRFWHNVDCDQQFF
jgi:hypothetical protein